MILEAVKKLLVLSILLTSAEKMHASQKDTEVPYVNYAKEIMNPFIAVCEKNYKLECIGTGGRFAYNVAGININFVAHRKGTIDEARTLEVKIIETLLSRINSDQQIKPFLSEHPFKANNLDISISYQKKDDSNYTDGSVALAFFAKNNLIYCAEDPKTGKLIDLLKEPYDEAVKIVNKTK